MQDEYQNRTEEDQDIFSDKFLSKKKAHELFLEYGYDFCFSEFSKTKWKELTPIPISNHHKTGRSKTLRVLKSECLSIIKKDIEHVRRQARISRKMKLERSI